MVLCASYQVCVGEGGARSGEPGIQNVQRKQTDKQAVTHNGHFEGFVAAGHFHGKHVNAVGGDAEAVLHVEVVGLALFHREGNHAVQIDLAIALHAVGGRAQSITPKGRLSVEVRSRVAAHYSQVCQISDMVTQSKSVAHLFTLCALCSSTALSRYPLG